MTNDLEIIAGEPAEFTDAERASFVQLVREGGEVDGRVLENNVENAKVLVFLRRGDQINGIAALKRPFDSYRERVSASAKVEIDETNFPYELGYVFITEEARGQRLSGVLVVEALNLVLGSGVFATARTDNRAMLATLENAEFKPEGEPYRGRDSRMIQIFVRRAL